MANEMMKREAESLDRSMKKLDDVLRTAVRNGAAVRENFVQAWIVQKRKWRATELNEAEVIEIKHGLNEWLAFMRAEFGLDDSVGSSDDPTVKSVLEQYAKAEADLSEARRTLIVAGMRARKRGAYLPDDVARQFTAARGGLASRISAFVTYVADQESIKIIGKDQKLIDYLTKNDWADAMLNSVPPLPREILRPEFRAKGNPFLTEAEKNLDPDAAKYTIDVGFLPLAAIPAGQVVAIALSAALLAWGAARVIESLNMQAVASRAEAERIKALAAQQLQIIDAMKATGASADQIDKALQKNSAPTDAPKVGFPWATAGLVVGGIGLAWFAYKSYTEKNAKVQQFAQ